MKGGIPKGGQQSNNNNGKDKPGYYNPEDIKKLLAHLAVLMEKAKLSQVPETAEIEIPAQYNRIVEEYFKKISDDIDMSKTDDEKDLTDE